MAEGEQRRQYYPGYFYNPGNDARNVDPYAPYGSSGLSHPQDLPRASYPGSAPRVLANEAIDLSGYHATVSGSRIASMPVDDFVKSVHEQGWVPPSRIRNSMQSGPQASMPGWYGGGPLRPGAMSDPTPHPDTYGDMSSENSMSEAGDSGYSSNIPAVEGPESLNQSSLHNPLAKHDFTGARAASGIHPIGTPMQQYSHPSSAPQSVVSDTRLQVPSRDPRKRYGKPTLQACPECGRAPKNHSDAKKHGLTHTKPFKCKEPDCHKKDGFATENDLQRHRKSVHKVKPTKGSSTYFICAACLPPEGGKAPKPWPRRDNFKAHVKRKHPTYDANELIESSKQEMQPDDAGTAVSFGQSSYPESLANSIDHRRVAHSVAPPIPDPSRRVSQSEEYGSLWPPSSMGDYPRGEASLLGGIGHAAITDASMLGSSELSTLPEPATSSGLSILSDVAFSRGDTTFMTTPPPDLAGTKRPRLNDGGYYYRGSEQNPPVVDLGAGSNVGAGSSDRPSTVSTFGNQGGYTCSSCGKVIARECDFKKHKKRHTRPYGCTFPRCSKRFGSRNDWKRHESSQHYLSEIWKCRRICADGTVCAHPPFPRLDHLKKHLTTKHKLTDTKLINEECAKYRLGKNANHHFWCGFCKELIVQTGGSSSYAYAIRFQHIGDHFDKDQCNIKDWECIELNKPKGKLPDGDVPMHRQASPVSEGEEGEMRTSVPQEICTPAGYTEPVKVEDTPCSEVTKHEERNLKVRRVRIEENGRGFHDSVW